MRKFLILIIACTVLLNTSCESHKNHKEEETKFLVTSPLIKDTSTTQEYVCQIRSIQHIEIRALERGYLQKIYVDEGQFVKKGQLMFQIMPLLYQAEMNKAQAEVDYAQIEYQNTKALSDSNIVSKNELALAKAQLDKAKAELALTHTHLNFTRIRAPFSGIMDRFHVREGSLIDEGELLTTLADNSKMWVYFNVTEAQYLNYQATHKKDSLIQVKLLLPNNEFFPFAGIIETIEADFNNETGNIAFRATFPNPNGLLRHGETGNIIMDIPLKKALLIPQKATFEVLDKNFVFVVGESGEVQARQITIETEMPQLYAISDGLTENDIILLEGLRKVNAGDRITQDFKEPKMVIANLELYAE